MKKLILGLCLTLLTAGFSFGQMDGGTSTPSFTIKDLEVMNKLELANIYSLQLKRFVELLPYVAFNQYDELTEDDLSIPRTSFNVTMVSKVDSAVAGFQTTMDETLPNLIPFSDKDKIIEGILFLQENIAEIENGMK